MAKPAAVNVLQRWIPIWHVFFYAMIGIATALAFTHGPSAPGRMVAAVALLVAWHAGLVASVGLTQRERPRRMAVYVAGAMLLSGYLLTIDATFMMVAMLLYNHVFAFLVMRWAVPAAAVLTAIIGAIELHTEGLMAMLVVGICAGSALVFAYFLNATSDENAKKRALIEELERTRGALALAERLAGKTEERGRIARELHDTVTQQLVGIVMHLDAARDREGSNGAREAIDHALTLARNGLAEARRLVWADRPRQLEEGSLRAALAAVFAEARAGGAFEVEPSVGSELDELPAAVQTLVLRVIQEGLANVRRHARAAKATVTATVDNDVLFLDIQDDGVGFDPSEPRAAHNGGGFGLRGLRQRAELLGGSVSVESVKGEGTTIALHVPLTARNA